MQLNAPLVSGDDAVQLHSTLHNTPEDHLGGDEYDIDELAPLEFKLEFVLFVGPWAACVCGGTNLVDGTTRQRVEQDMQHSCQ